MSSNKIILYHSNWSLCSQMVRVALFEKEIPFIQKHIKLCDQYPEGENLDKFFLDINPLATVPAIKINNEVICDSEKIIRKLDSLNSPKNIDLYTNNTYVSNLLISETTITEGVKFATTIGTIMPVFSASLIQFMIKKLPLKSIIKIFLKHPRKDRKIFFISMYFFNFTKNIPKIGVKKFAKELIRFENLLSKDNKYFYEEFSHIDINMMCLINRLKDLKLERCLYSGMTPLLSIYWENLKKRDSYKKAILDFYTDKEHKTIKEFYQNQTSDFLDTILNELEKLN